MRETIFLTGASGLIGGVLLDRFLDRDVGLLIARHEAMPTLRRGRAEVEVVDCDLTKSRFGLTEAEYRRLARKTQSILHCAGRTDFAATRKAAREANVRQVENLLAFVGAAPRIRRVALLSTIYVAGKRTGIIRECELTHRAGFVNEYERSKYEAEQIVRQAMRRLPISVYRLSTILSSREGCISRLGAIHHALRFFHAGLVPMIPGAPASEVDLISSDYAADAIDALFASFSACATHHIAAGSKNRIPLQAFVDRTADLFAANDSRWKAFASPPIVALKTFRRLQRTVELANDAVMTQVMRTMSRFAPQLAYPKTFDDGPTREILRAGGVEEDRFDAFYPRFVGKAIASRWGKRA